MAWSIEFTLRAAKAFRKLDKPVQKQISKFLREVAELNGLVCAVKGSSRTSLDCGGGE